MPVLKVNGYNENPRQNTILAFSMLSYRRAIKPSNTVHGPIVDRDEMIHRSAAQADKLPSNANA